MSILTALTSHLLNDAALSALIGSRLYPERLPDSTTATPNTMPLVTYQLIQDDTFTTMAGALTFRARVQIDSWGGTYKSAHAAAAAVFSALQGFTGAMGDQSVIVGGCFRKIEADASDPNVHLYRVRQEYAVNWKEA